jgi:hypothetical protein
MEGGRGKAECERGKEKAYGRGHSGEGKKFSGVRKKAKRIVSG